MKNKIIKSVIVILLIIEFYPIESNSQDLPEGRNYSLISGKTEAVSENYKLSDPVLSEDKKVAEIKFRIFNEGKVSLNVFDSEGKMIEALAEGDMDAGEYVVYFKTLKEINPADYNYILDYNGNKICKRIMPVK
jgi:hypothetical protein